MKLGYDKEEITITEFNIIYFLLISGSSPRYNSGHKSLRCWCWDSNAFL